MNTATRTLRIKGSTGERQQQAHLPQVPAEYKMAPALLAIIHFQAHFPPSWAMPFPHLLPSIQGHAEHSLQSGRARSRGPKSVSMPWCSPGGTYLFFMTFKLVHPKVLHLSRYCLGRGTRALVYPLVSCSVLLISVPLWGTLLVVSGALVNNATGNRRCDHLQGV